MVDLFFCIYCCHLVTTGSIVHFTDFVYIVNLFVVLIIVTLLTTC